MVEPTVLSVRNLESYRTLKSVQIHTPRERERTGENKRVSEDEGTHRSAALRSTKAWQDTSTKTNKKQNRAAESTWPSVRGL